MRSIGFLVFAMACGGGGDDGPGFFLDASTGGASSTDPALEGTWEFRICSASSRYSTTLTVAGNQQLWRRTHFLDTDMSCTEPFAVDNWILEHSIGEPSIITTGAREIDLEDKGTTIAPVTADVAAHWSSLAYCGHTNWSPGIARDVSGTSCVGGNGSMHRFPYIGEMTYDIYRVDGTQLRFGSPASGSGTSDGTRPTQLGVDYFTRR